MNTPKKTSQQSQLFEKVDPYHALSMPVYNSIAFEFDTAEEMEAAFCGKSNEHFYSRITNPTVQHFERTVQQLTGATSVTALNSGMAAITNTFFAIAQAGGNIVTSSHLFGNTFSFLNGTFRAFGVDSRFCDLTSPEAVRAQIDENTCAIFLEIITNPQLEVADLKELSAIAKEAGVPLIADTTIVPFCQFNAPSFGIDIEVVSSTKYISGGATSLGGLVIDYGTFDWLKSKKLAQLAQQQGYEAFTFKMRREIHRNLGAYMSPQVAYMQTLGLETLAVRYKQQSHTCLQLTKRLQTLKGIERVNYTGLEDNPFYQLSKAQFGDYPGAMFTIDLASREACFKFMNKLKVWRRATNLFDNKSLAIHTASTIYGTFTEEQRMAMDVSQKTIRFSVGLEDADALFEDIKQALA